MHVHTFEFLRKPSYTNCTVHCCPQSSTQNNELTEARGATDRYVGSVGTWSVHSVLDILCTVKSQYSAPLNSAILDLVRIFAGPLTLPI